MSAGASARGGPSPRAAEWWLSAPSLGWLTVFFAVPTILLAVLSFKAPGDYGGFGEGWTLRAWREAGRAGHAEAVWRTLWLSALATLLCVGAALPAALVLARSPRRWRTVLLLLVVVPFWTSFLIRVYAWKVLLHPAGYLRRFLTWAGLAGEDAVLLYNEWTVLTVLVYAHLPFAILPLYAAAERFDFSLLDAARDLGCGALRAFWTVFVPGVRRGVMAAAALVMIPALGSYLIPDLVGGPSGEMIGNLIARGVFVDRDWPLAAALATLLMAVTLLPVLLAWAQGGAGRRAALERRGGAEQGGGREARA